MVSAGSVVVAIAAAACGAATPATTNASAPTPAERARRLTACLASWNEGRIDDTRTCFAPNATAERPGSRSPALVGPDAIIDATRAFTAGFPDRRATPELLLIDGNVLIAIVMITGTNTAPFSLLANAPRTGRKVGFLIAQVIALDARGDVEKISTFVDTTTILGQLGTSSDQSTRAALTAFPYAADTVVGRDDRRREANLTTYRNELAAFNRHDAKALSGFLDDALVWSESPDARDHTKAEEIAVFEEFWAGSSDSRLTIEQAWAAGDYVAAVVRVDGTNDRDTPGSPKTGKAISVPFVEIRKLARGKTIAAWSFYDGIQFAQQLGP